MPIIKSAIKRMRQTTKRNARNVSVKRDLKGAVKAFIAKPSVSTLSAAQSELDTMVKKNLLPKNTAARRKAQLSRVAKEAGVKTGTTKKTTTKAPVKTAPKPAATTKAPAKKPVAKKTATKKPAAKTTK
ncbi:MAG: 30S ribosomal protein S20 [Candidatus Saccharimonadales bacterium]